jgi:nucleoside-diphosphate-sugar epimerase
MKLTIFAATGGIGRRILEQAVDAGHDVTAVVRDPQKLPGELSSQVRVVTADPAAPNPATLRSGPASKEPMQCSPASARDRTPRPSRAGEPASVLLVRLLLGSGCARD